MLCRGTADEWKARGLAVFDHRVVVGLCPVVARSFRFVPPEPRSDVLARRHLLRALLGRWEHPVSLVVGGPGLGKTTLLAQVLAENRLAPRGEDVWVGVEPHDIDGEPLSLAVTSALALGGDGEVTVSGESQARDPGVVAEAVWQRSPEQVCVVLDDVQLLPAGCAGALWLQRFVDVLPANGHLLLASRSEPALALARLEGIGAVLRLGEDDLRLSAEELDAFAARRGVTRDVLAGSGGWPAMAELAANAADQRPGAFLWEEVLEPLGEQRRRVLAVVSDLGGADDRLASASIGVAVDLRRVLGDVPLVAVGADGWHVPHPLWRDAPDLALAIDERARVRRRAVQDLIGRGRIDQAFTLIQEGDLWDQAPAVLRAACLASERLNPRQLERCLAASPRAARTSPAGYLATALRLAFTQPASAIEPLRVAADQSRAAGDVEAELTALAQLGRLAWGRQDLAAIGGDVAGRIAAIEATGNPMASGLAAFMRALIADLDGDDNVVLAELDAIEPGVLDPVWTAMALWLRGGVRLDRGEAEAVVEILADVEPTSDPAIIAILGGLRARVWWALGRLDDVVAKIPDLLGALREAGVASIHAQGLINASLALSYAGDGAAARDSLAEAAAAVTEPIGGLSVRTALATASLQLAEGDEPGAAATLRHAMAGEGRSEKGADRRAWRHVLALSYVLVPQTRPSWDAAALRGHLAVAREFAAALVSTRGGVADDRLWRLDLSDLGRVRAALHYRHAAELAVALAAAGRSEAAALLDALGPAGRAAVGDLASMRTRQAKWARSLLALAPAPPPQVSYLGVFGPLRLARDTGTGDGPGEVVDPDLRRARVRALLAYLVGHRRTQRTAILAALWPNTDPHAAANNLAVTLNYLLRVLEPWRRAGQPPYLIRLDGQTVELVTGPYLHIDVDQFDRHLASAAHAEAEGSASAALDHDLAASELYRGELFADVEDADWLDLDREHYRTRFVTISIRAAQLLLGQDNIEQAQRLAQRVLTADPWNEDAYTVLATAALTRGDRSTARSILTRCLTVLDDFGADPSPTTQQVARRCGMTSSASAHSSRSSRSLPAS
jgi:DNA-binding SARP family transcriptional activator